MKPKEYEHARDVLEWTHDQLGGTIGVSERTTYRYASGDTGIPPPVARLLRLLVLLRLTMSKRKFEEITTELRE